MFRLNTFNKKQDISLYYKTVTNLSEFKIEQNSVNFANGVMSLVLQQGLGTISKYMEFWLSIFKKLHFMKNFINSPWWVQKLSLLSEQRSLKQENKPGKGHIIIWNIKTKSNSTHENKKKKKK